MQPLSPRVRRSYLALSITLFFAILPVVILYADGWRWTPESGFYKTGGVFVAVPYQDADVFVNGEHVGRSGFLDRSFYVSNLGPGSYLIRVEHVGYLPWSRTLVVEPQLVTDAEVLLIPKRVEPAFLTFSGTATTGVEVISRTQYDAYLEEFEVPEVVPAIAGLNTPTTTPQDESGGIGLFVEEGDVFARWMSEDAFPSSRFCARPSFCELEIIIEQGSEEALTARFFHGGIVFSTSEGNVYFTEADVRFQPTSVTLFEAEEVDIRVIDNELFVKTENALYRINL